MYWATPTYVLGACTQYIWLSNTYIFKKCYPIHICSVAQDIYDAPQYIYDVPQYIYPIHMVLPNTLTLYRHLRYIYIVVQYICVVPQSFYPNISWVREICIGYMSWATLHICWTTPFYMYWVTQMLPKIYTQYI